MYIRIHTKLIENPGMDAAIRKYNTAKRELRELLEEEDVKFEGFKEEAPFIKEKPPTISVN